MKLNYLFILSFFLLLHSCDDLKESQACTDIFKTTSIHIEGTELHRFYTLRLSNKDTIRIPSYEANTYPVLNDSYQDTFANNKDSFHFVGIVNDSVLLVEPFVFSADDCHIHYISGNLKISF